jgi:hypothetical protein
VRVVKLLELNPKNDWLLPVNSLKNGIHGAEVFENKFVGFDKRVPLFTYTELKVRLTKIITLDVVDDNNCELFVG